MSPGFRTLPVIAVMFCVLAGAAVANVAEDARGRVRDRLQAERQRIEALTEGVGSRMPVPADAVDLVKDRGVPERRQGGRGPGHQPGDPVGRGPAAL